MSRERTRALEEGKLFWRAHGRSQGPGKALALAALLLCSAGILPASACAAPLRKAAAKRVVEIRDCQIIARAEATGKLSCRCEDPVVSEQVDARTGEVKRVAQCAKGSGK